MTYRPRAYELALFMALLAGCAGNPTATLRQNFQSLDSDEVKEDRATTLLEVGVEGTIGPDLTYRLADRYIYSDSLVEVDDAKISERRHQNRLSLDTIANLGTFVWTQALEYFVDRLDSSAFADNDGRRTEVFEKLEWSPIDLPKFTGWINYKTREDDLFVNRDELLTLLQIEDSRDPIDYVYTFETETLKERNSDVRRDRSEHIFRFGYNDFFFDDTIIVGGSFFLDDQTTNNRTSGGLTGPNPGGEIPLVAGLSAIDNTPATGSLLLTPSLIDGDEATSTGINIGGAGSGGGIDRNIGVEVPANFASDLILLFTEMEVQAIFTNQFAFSVWSSQDNNFWTLVTNSAGVTYERALRRFRILIPEVTARYVKVVNTSSPVAAPAVFVTEIRVFGPAGRGTGSTTTTIRDNRWSAAGNITWQPIPDFSLGYAIFFQKTDRKRDGDRTQDETRIDHTLRSFWAPIEEISVNLLANLQTTDDEILADSEFRLLSAVIEYLPIETLEFALGITDSKRDQEPAADLDTTAIQTRASAQLLDSLRAELTYEWNEQESQTADATIQRNIFGASIFAQLTSDWDFTFTARKQVGDVSGAGANVVPDPDQTNIEGIILFRPSDRFTVEADIEWQDTFVGDGINQRYTVDWIPFQDGRIDVQLDYQRLTSDIGNTNDFDRFNALTRYTFTPRAFLEVNYTYINPRRNLSPTQILSITLNITL